MPIANINIRNPNISDHSLCVCVSPVGVCVLCVCVRAWVPTCARACVSVCACMHAYRCLRVFVCYLRGGDVLSYVHDSVVVQSKAFDFGHDRRLYSRVSDLVRLLMHKHPPERGAGEEEGERRERGGWRERG